MKIIVGLDPGISHTGVVCVSFNGILASSISYRCVETLPDNTKRVGDDTRRRLKHIGDTVISMTKEFVYPTMIHGVRWEEVLFSMELYQAPPQGRDRGGKSHGSRHARKTYMTAGLVHGITVALGARLIEPTPHQIRKSLGLPPDATKEHIANALAVRWLQIRTPTADLLRGVRTAHREHIWDAMGAAHAAWYFCLET